MPRFYWAAVSLILGLNEVYDVYPKINEIDDISFVNKAARSQPTDTSAFNATVEGISTHPETYKPHYFGGIHLVLEFADAAADRLYEQRGRIMSAYNQVAAAHGQTAQRSFKDKDPDVTIAYFPVPRSADGLTQREAALESAEDTIWSAISDGLTLTLGPTQLSGSRKG
jgi:hypothetical protein